MSKDNTEVKEQSKPRGRPPGVKETKPRNISDEQRKKNAESMQKINASRYPASGEGYNTKQIQFMLEIMPRNPLDKNDVQEMERRFEHYLETCAKYDVKVGNLAAYTAIGVGKDEIRGWIQHPKANPERAEFGKKVVQFCAMYREGLMGDGKVNPVTGIFWQKNYDGFRDQTEMVVTPGNQNDDYKSAEQLEKKYLEASEVGSLPVIETTAEEVDTPK